jgi:hypothetical protein
MSQSLKVIKHLSTSLFHLSNAKLCIGPEAHHYFAWCHFGGMQFFFKMQNPCNCCQEDCQNNNFKLNTRQIINGFFFLFRSNNNSVSFKKKKQEIGVLRAQNRSTAERNRPIK